ncbi:unnamed protein product [Ranitomeya imitator]|uniref:Uncharacterized protein n=1 Tax=Ranitomeya imitator TaxID=111125 RepID=A0ABN9MJ89_9NEOB|nr:unnamed protein product [Ranitomeya imitator]
MGLPRRTGEVTAGTGIDFSIASVMVLCLSLGAGEVGRLDALVTAELLGLPLRVGDANLVSTEGTDSSRAEVFMDLPRRDGEVTSGTSSSISVVVLSLPLGAGEVGRLDALVTAELLGLPLRVGDANLVSEGTDSSRAEDFIALPRRDGEEITSGTSSSISVVVLSLPLGVGEVGRLDALVTEELLGLPLRVGDANLVSEGTDSSGARVVVFIALPRRDGEITSGTSSASVAVLCLPVRAGDVGSSGALVTAVLVLPLCVGDANLVSTEGTNSFGAEVFMDLPRRDGEVTSGTSSSISVVVLCLRVGEVGRLDALVTEELLGLPLRVGDANLVSTEGTDSSRAGEVVFIALPRRDGEVTSRTSLSTSVVVLCLPLGAGEVAGSLEMVEELCLPLRLPNLSCCVGEASSLSDTARDSLGASDLELDLPMRLGEVASRTSDSLEAVILGLPLRAGEVTLPSATDSLDSSATILCLPL